METTTTGKKKKGRRNRHRRPPSSSSSSSSVTTTTTTTTTGDSNNSTTPTTTTIMLSSKAILNLTTNTNTDEDDDEQQRHHQPLEEEVADDNQEEKHDDEVITTSSNNNNAQHYNHNPKASLDDDYDPDGVVVQEQLPVPTLSRNNASGAAGRGNPERIPGAVRVPGITTTTTNLQAAGTIVIGGGGSTDDNVLVVGENVGDGFDEEAPSPPLLLHAERVLPGNSGNDPEEIRRQIIDQAPLAIQVVDVEQTTTTTTTKEEGEFSSRLRYYWILGSILVIIVVVGLMVGLAVAFDSSSPNEEGERNIPSLLSNSTKKDDDDNKEVITSCPCFTREEIRSKALTSQLDCSLERGMKIGMFPELYVAVGTLLGATMLDNSSAEPVCTRNDIELDPVTGEQAAVTNSMRQVLTPTEYEICDDYIEEICPNMTETMPVPPTTTCPCFDMDRLVGTIHGDNTQVNCTTTSTTTGDIGDETTTTIRVTVDSVMTYCTGTGCDEIFPTNVVLEEQQCLTAQTTPEGDVVGDSLLHSVISEGEYQICHEALSKICQ